MILLITSATATRDGLPPRRTDDSHTRFRGRRVSLRIGFNAGVLFKEFLSTRPRKNIQRRCEVTIQKNKQSVFFFSSLPPIGREVNVYLSFPVVRGSCRASTPSFRAELGVFWFLREPRVSHLTLWLLKVSGSTCLSCHACHSFIYFYYRRYFLCKLLLPKRPSSALALL